MRQRIRWDDKWITENHLRYPSYKEMLKAYNEIHNCDVKLAALKNHTHYKLGIKKPRETHKHYTDEQIEFLKEMYPKHGCRKTMEMFNRRFHESRTMSSMKNFGINYGIQVNEDVRINNRTRLNHGKRAVRKVGSVREECGRLVMKMPDGKWTSVGRAIWKLNGNTLPNGYSVIHLDGNVNNYTIQNLLAVPNKYVGLLQKYGMRSESADITKTGVKWCELYDALNIQSLDV